MIRFSAGMLMGSIGMLIGFVLGVVSIAIPVKPTANQCCHCEPVQINNGIQSMLPYQPDYLYPVARGIITNHSFQYRKP